MLKNRITAQSNRILLSNLLHLSRIVVFASLPIALHFDHLEYMRDFYRFPPLPGDPIPTPLPYPTPLVYITIAVIVLDLIVLWKLLRRNNGYDIRAACLFPVELLLLLTMPDYMFLIFSVVSLIGFLEILLLISSSTIE